MLRHGEGLSTDSSHEQKSFKKNRAARLEPWIFLPYITDTNTRMYPVISQILWTHAYISNKKKKKHIFSGIFFPPDLLFAWFFPSDIFSVCGFFSRYLFYGFFFHPVFSVFFFHRNFLIPPWKYRFVITKRGKINILSSYQLSFIETPSWISHFFTKLLSHAEHSLWQSK